MASAYEVPGQKVGLKASVDLTTKRFKALVVDNTGGVTLAGADAVICGVNQREARLGEATSVMINGITFAYLGGTVASGDKVSTDVNSNFVKTTAGPVAGICLFGGVSGDLSCILIK